MAGACALSGCSQTVADDGLALERPASSIKAPSKKQAHVAAFVTKGPAVVAKTGQAKGSGERAGQDKSKENSVASSVRKTLARSPELKLAEYEIAEAGGNVEIARSGYFPTLDSEAKVGSDDSEGYKVSISQPLFDWGKTRATVRRARTLKTGAELRLHEIRENTARDAAIAHASIVRDRTLLKVAKTNFEAHKAIHKLAMDRLEGGVSDTGESTLADVKLNEAEQGVVDAQSDLTESRRDYNRLIGQAPGGLIDPEYFKLDSQGNGALNSAVANAPAVRIAELSQTVAEQTERLERSEFLPKLSVDAYAQTNNNNRINNNQSDVGVVLRLKGPTFNGLSQFYKYKNAQLRQQSAVHERERARRSVEQAVQRYRGRAPQLMRRIRLLRTRSRSARRLVEDYKSQFLLGSRSLLDLFNAQQQVSSAEIETVEVRFEIHQLQYQAASALGELTYLLGVSETKEQI